MKNLLLIIILIYRSQLIQAQCTCNYSYSGTNSDSVAFTNLSSVSNAHYYWEFGDGSGSNDINPVHYYFSSGLYLVTLYALDTASNCSNYFQNWITVLKPDTSACNVYFEDTIIGNSFPMTDLSTNCSNYHLNCGIAANGFHFCNSGFGNWYPGLFLHSEDARTNDSISGYIPFDHWVRTLPFQHDPNNNYQSCSANFEITYEFQQTGVQVTFTAMNKHATGYRFEVSGFGNPIYTFNNTTSKFYPYYGEYTGWLVALIVTDSINNCADSVTRELLIFNPYFRRPSDCSTSIYPQNQTVHSGTDVKFIISTSPYVQKQWQENDGHGYVDLYDAGPYSGVHTDTLTISNAQLTMNNFHYQCIISGDTSGCHNTIPEVVLFVNSVGIDELNSNRILIYPTIVNSSFTVEFQEVNPNAIISIVDISGNVILKDKLVNMSSIINVPEISSGFYLIVIEKNSIKYHYKIFKV